MVTASPFYRFEGIWSAWGEANVFLIPVLLGLALLAWRRPREVRGARFYLLAVALMVGWRVAYAWSMRGGTRYQVLPVILAIPVAVAGLYAPRRFFSSRRLAVAAALLLAGAMTTAAIVKDLRHPKSDKMPLISAVGEVLRAEGRPGIVLDDSSSALRLKRELPDFEFVFEHHLQPRELVFWRQVSDFIRRRQVEGKPLYLLLQTPRDSDVLEEFRIGCLREWGILPFVSLLRCRDRNSQYELFRYRPPQELFGLRCSTPALPNPDGPFLPPDLQIQRGKPYRLEFRRIMTDPRYFQWGGVEADVRFGAADDVSWRFTPDAKTPETFPLSVTLYAPNGWPTGYAATTVRVVDHPVELPPVREAAPRDIDWKAKPKEWARSLPVPPEVPGEAEPPLPLRFDDLGNLSGDREDSVARPAVRLRKAEALRGPVFWIGSRVWGTTWLTDALRKANPELQIFRLEQHPKLPYSKDPRYTFAGLAAPRPPLNPLLNEDGAIDWGGYLRRQRFPAFRRIVLALGYEETMWGAGRTAFHIDHAESALRRFLDAVRRDAPGCRVLLILPGMPSLRQKDYEAFTANPYIYGFRWWRRHCYRRLVEAVFRVAGEYPEITVLPTYLWLPPGTDERHPQYRRVIQLYLHDLQGEVGVL